MASLSNSEIVHLALTRFAQNLIQQRQANVRSANATASEELLNSYDYLIIKETSNQLAAAFIEFEGHGRYLDMKRLDRSNSQIPLNAIKNWIKEKGLSNFRKKPKLKGGVPLVGNRLINEIAWGIVRKKRGRVRNKLGAKISFGTEDLLQQLISDLREGFVDGGANEIIDSFKNKN